MYHLQVPPDEAAKLLGYLMRQQWFVDQVLSIADDYYFTVDKDGCMVSFGMAARKSPKRRR